MSEHPGVHEGREEAHRRPREELQQGGQARVGADGRLLGQGVPPGLLPPHLRHVRLHLRVHRVNGPREGKRDLRDLNWMAGARVGVERERGGGGRSLVGLRSHYVAPRMSGNI